MVAVTAVLAALCCGFLVVEVSSWTFYATATTTTTRYSNHKGGDTANVVNNRHHHHHVKLRMVGLFETLVGSRRRTKRTTSIPNYRRHHHALFGILEDVQNERNEEEPQDDETSSSSPTPTPPSSSNHGNESNNMSISILRAIPDITSTADDEEDDDTEMETTTNTNTLQPVVEVDLSTYIETVSELKENKFLLETLRASADITSTDDDDDDTETETPAKTKTNTQPVVEVDLSTYIEIVSELKENKFLLETLIFSSIDGGGDVRNEIAINLEAYSNPKFLQYLAQLLEDSKDPEEQEAYQELIDIIEDYSI